MEIDRSIVLSQTLVRNAQIAEAASFPLSIANFLVDGECLLKESDRCIVLSQTKIRTA
ncbi:MAG: hypothetical protein RLZZ435_3463 [Cyanobacteriota bacterium]